MLLSSRSTIAVQITARIPRLARQRRSSRKPHPPLPTTTVTSELIETLYAWANIMSSLDVHLFFTIVPRTQVWPSSAHRTYLDITSAASLRCDCLDDGFHLSAVSGPVIHFLVQTGFPLLSSTCQYPAGSSRIICYVLWRWGLSFLCHSKERSGCLLHVTGISFDLARLHGRKNLGGYWSVAYIHDG